MLKPWTTASIIAALVLTASVIAAGAQIQTLGAGDCMHEYKAPRRSCGRLPVADGGLIVHLGRPPVRTISLVVRPLLLSLGTHHRHSPKPLGCFKFWRLSLHLSFRNPALSERAAK